MDPVALTNTEKLALGKILADEEAAERKARLLRKAFDDDLRARLGVGAAGTLRIDIATGTVEHVIQPDAADNFVAQNDAIPN